MKELLVRYITLNPYGQNLKSPQTKFWIISIGLIIFLMSFTEGFIWANLFNFYFETSLSFWMRILLCVGIGIVVFSLLWLIDTSFALLDTSETPANKDIKWNSIRNQRNKIIGGFLVRLALTAFSLYITVPAITKLSISQDIDKYITDENNQTRHLLRNEIDSTETIEIIKKDSVLQKRKNDLIDEIAGQGKSGRYGDKEAAKAVRENLKRDSVELENIKNELHDELNYIDSASMDALSQKYGVKVKEKTAGVINEVSKELSRNESYKQVEKISRTYVLLLFIGLVILKIFAPRSVKIYLNEELQDLYRAYKNNQINSIYFANFKDEFDNAVDVTPYRFYEFWEGYYYNARIQDIKNSASDEELKKLDIKIAKFNQQRKDIEKELTPVQNELVTETELLLKMEEEKMKMELEINSIKERINEISGQINTIKTSKPNVRPEDLIELSKQQTQLLKEQDEITPKIHSINNEITIKQKKIKFVQDKIDLANKELTSLQKNLDKMIELKEYLRNQYFEGLK